MAGLRSAQAASPLQCPNLRPDHRCPGSSVASAIALHGGQRDGDLSLAPLFVYVIALTVLYTWLFNSTRGSVLIVTVFHAASNTVGSFDLAEAVVVFLLASVIVVVFGPAHLSRRGKRIVREEGL